MFLPSFAPLTFSADIVDSDTGILTSYILKHNRVHLSYGQAFKISRDIVRQSALLGVPVDLGVAIMERESSFNPKAINQRSGDYGLFQIHYSFWKKHFVRKKGSRLWALSFKDLYQIDVNVRVGMMIIRHDLVLSQGSVSRMIGFYSGRKGNERDLYVMSVLANEKRFRDYQKKFVSLVQLR
jgi:soluble lytic murein transglycosylase-like protein